MESHELPTHLAVEDKILAGLTPRQILLLAIGIALAFSLWHRLVAWSVPDPLSIAAAAVVLGVALLVVHVRPDGRHLESWALAYLRYRSVAKVYIFGRTASVGAIGADLLDEVEDAPVGSTRL